MVGNITFFSDLRFLFVTVNAMDKLQFLVSITVTNICQSFTHKMVVKTN